MKINEIFVAEVKENDSIKDIENPKRDGRVQIYIEPIMSGWSSYPWARPLASGSGVSWIPDIGDKLWVFCLREAVWEDWYYIGIAEFRNDHPHDKLPTEYTYPEYRYFKYRDSFIAFGDKIHIEHKSGTTVTIDSNGDVVIDGADITVKAQKAFIDSQDITLGGSSGKVLTTISDPLVDNITGAPHVGSSIIKGV